MTLINCPECGKELSDKAAYCIQCGYPMDLKNKTEELKKKKSRGFFGGVFLIIILIAIVIGVLVITKMNYLSTEEKYVLNIIEKYQAMLKAPDSLNLQSDIVVIKSYDAEQEARTHCFFTAGGSNSYGAMVTATECFVDGKYFCDLNDIPDTVEYMDLSDEEVSEYLLLELRLAGWRLYGENYSEEDEEVIKAYSVDAKKISNKLRLK